MKPARMTACALALLACLAANAGNAVFCLEADTLLPRLENGGARQISADSADVSATKTATSGSTANVLPAASDSVAPLISAADSIGVEADSSGVAADTSLISQAVDSVMRDAKTHKPPRPKFVPDPQRALWLALVLPGAGQIYNRKYWKLPIFYGGFLGCTYALMWNQQMYKDYSQAYSDIMDDDPNTDSYLDMLPPNYDISGMEEQFQRIFKNRKDRYRRWRDLSVFAFAAVYILSVIDAYVDAQLSEFDISRDLSLNVAPTIISVQGKSNARAVGVGCGLSF